MSENIIIRVKDIMNQKVKFVDGKDTIRNAIEKMTCDCLADILVVEKRNEDDEYGVVRLGDISKNVLAQGKSPDRVNIYEIMTKPALCISERMDIRYCARLFNRFDLHAAPVINDKGLVVGIISHESLILKGLLGLS